MSLINSDVIPASATGGYTIDQSLRFNDDDTAYLSRTPSSAGNRKTWTWSAWVKRGNIKGSTTSLLGSGTASNNYCYLGFTSSEVLQFQNNASSGNQINVTTSGVFRDVSAWYHIVLSVDTTQATNSNGVKIYINGEQQTLSFSTYTQNTETLINNTNAHILGDYISGGGLYLDGYMSEVNFIDGQALDPTYFGETGDYGEWKPIRYTGSYGTNGFYLDFDGTYYNDKSGNGNNWTATNLATTDVVLDSPTNNFCTMNPLNNGSYTTLSEGNLKLAGNSTVNNGNTALTMFPTSGKWYFEYNVTDTAYYDYYPAVVIYADDSLIGLNGGTGWGSSRSFANLSGSHGDIVGVALDIDNLTAKFYLNGTYSTGNDLTLADPNTGGGISISATAYIPSNQGAVAITNFGQDSSFAGNKTAQGNTDENGIGDFYYTPPSGYLALCTSNLSEPDIIPSEHFNTITYTGTGASRSITGVGFQPDYVWTKARNYDHHQIHANVLISDYYLYSSSTNSESTIANGISSYDTDGYSMGSAASLNQSGLNFVSWNWKAGGSGSSNTNGSVTSTVSANQDAGFSIVTWTSSGGSDTVGHGLSQKPDLFMARTRDSTSGWYVMTTVIDGSHDYLLLTSDAVKTNSGETVPTSSVISWNTGLTENHIAYCFHSVEGFSKIGTYTGNGSSDGPFVYTGFRPAWVMVKRTDVIASWVIHDSIRSPYNEISGAELFADLYQGEGSYDNDFDYLSNGFKCTGTNGATNGSSNSYIYIAFAETPFSVGGGIAR